MALPKNILFHTLKGKKGWSSFYRQTIDVAKVSSMSYRGRFFKLFDQECDYTLEISYRELTKESDFAPTFVAGSKGPSLGITLVDTIKTDQVITARYTTEDDVIAEMNQIQNKQQKLKEVHEKHYGELRTQFPN